MNSPAPYRLVATDLDGTLLDDRGQIGAVTKDVLAQLDTLAVPVVFVTGRPVRWMEDLWPLVGGLGLAICSNGAVTFDVGARTVLDAQLIAEPTALEVAGDLRREFPEMTFSVERLDGPAYEDRFPVHPDDHSAGHDTASQTVERGPLEELMTPGCVKLLGLDRASDGDPSAFLSAVRRIVEGRLTVTLSATFALVEMSAPGVTKASALQRLCEARGIAAADVVAFGDMPNDVEMLAWAGGSYAMSTAHPEAVAAATRRAGSNNHDGVATVLAELFGL